MKVYDIDDGFGYSQTHCVVADNMGEAEELFCQKYKTTVRAIKLHSEYVIVKEAASPALVDEVIRLRAEVARLSVNKNEPLYRCNKASKCSLSNTCVHAKPHIVQGSCLYLTICGSSTMAICEQLKEEGK